MFFLEFKRVFRKLFKALKYVKMITNINTAGNIISFILFWLWRFCAFPDLGYRRNLHLIKDKGTIKFQVFIKIFSLMPYFHFWKILENSKIERRYIIHDCKRCRILQ